MPGGLDNAVNDTVQVADAAIGDIPRIVISARARCAVGVQHLEHDRFAGLKSAGGYVRRGAGRVIGLVGGDARGARRE